ncbi:glycosyltransferase family 2 protein [Methylobacter sp. Wu8]|uniref:Dolichol-phosphate mannosyltransferase n=1 Tax=Methylobacter tundripaludum TaxID=173365 RepID=A0A2S6GXM1_9GAMM|nr:glycosyltransferase family 2 protein [Methylobacter tundripaludum]MCF7965972.1 glycosyltransferase family 2 protein [Methylobacter tundripaludum]MCK9637040.1 glycosyltransferase family 2 protein [Methylobacter tundripaludum]MDD2661978.1 glycosyltransferase family 2 protein [Methylococcales bacterium]PPK69948.1 dolichol-phosphate mannosyltransferase [Methylobacter tundripaludum]
MKISIVVPVYNEADNIVSLIEEIVTAMNQAEAYEIIYVDDGSNDGTATVLRQTQQHIKVLRVIRHQQSCGQSAAIHTGVKAANYSCIATLDGDGQNDPADIPRLHEILMQQRKINSNLWMVAGWRNRRHDSAWRLFSSKVANAVRSRLLGDNTPDTGCGLKVFLRDKFLTLPYFDHMHRFLPALVLRAGGQVISEPVRHRVRVHGYSKYGTLDRLWVGIADILGVIWLQRRAKLPEASE